MSSLESESWFFEYLKTVRGTERPYTQDEIDDLLAEQVPIEPNEEPDVYGPNQREGEYYGSN